MKCRKTKISGTKNETSPNLLRPRARICVQWALLRRISKRISPRVKNWQAWACPVRYQERQVQHLASNPLRGQYPHPWVDPLVVPHRYRAKYSHDPQRTVSRRAGCLSRCEPRQHSTEVGRSAQDQAHAAADQQAAPPQRCESLRVQTESQTGAGPIRTSCPAHSLGQIRNFFVIFGILIPISAQFWLSFVNIQQSHYHGGSHEQI